MADIFSALYNFVAGCTWLGTVIGKTVLGLMFWVLVAQIQVEIFMIFIAMF